jgi:hypothetical protein
LLEIKKVREINPRNSTVRYFYLNLAGLKTHLTGNQLNNIYFSNCGMIQTGNEGGRRKAKGKELKADN